MDIKKIRKNLDAIAKGVWVDNIPNAGGLQLLVRGMNAPEVREFRASLERAAPPEHRRRDGSITQEHALSILSETLLEKVLLDWEGLKDDGNEVKYNKALAKEWLTNPEYEDFGDAVVWAANFVDRSRKTEEEAAKGNSSKS